MALVEVSSELFINRFICTFDFFYLHILLEAIKESINYISVKATQKNLKKVGKTSHKKIIYWQTKHPQSW